jgi:transposase InsO family protein
MLKARHRKRLRTYRAEHRTSVEVLAKDVIWVQDALHAGRVEREGILAEVVKDRGSLATVALGVGGAAKGLDIVAMLENQKIEGRLPLVWATDNSPAYKSREVADFCRRERLVHLFSRPHTPQDNGSAERGIGELKAESGLGRGVMLCDAREAALRLVEAGRLANQRPRACRGMKSAVQLEKGLSVGPKCVDRKAFYSAACRSAQKAVKGGGNIRVKKGLANFAIYKLLEKNNLVRIVRGGKNCCVGQKVQEDIL